MRKHFEAARGRGVADRASDPDIAVPRVFNLSRVIMEKAALAALGMVARDGFEPPTQGFSVLCSTD